jgi:hypothetical protein
MGVRRHWCNSERSKWVSCLEFKCCLSLWKKANLPSRDVPLYSLIVFPDEFHSPLVYCHFVLKLQCLSRIFLGAARLEREFSGIRRPSKVIYIPPCMTVYQILVSAMLYDC